MQQQDLKAGDVAGASASGSSYNQPQNLNKTIFFNACKGEVFTVQKNYKLLAKKLKSQGYNVEEFEILLLFCGNSVLNFLKIKLSEMFLIYHLTISKKQI